MHIFILKGGQLPMALSDGMELFYEKTGCGHNENGH